MIDMLKPLKKIVISKADKKKKITPLMVAAMRGDLETVKALLKDKTKANINAKTKKKDTALHYAVRFRNKNIALLLIQMGAKVDIKNSKKETPLHEVVNVFDQEDRRELTRALFAKGADIAENNKGETVMHLAVRKNMPEFILFLKENIGQMAKNKKGQTPLDVAKELGKTKDMGAVIDLLSGKK